MAKFTSPCAKAAVFFGQSNVERQMDFAGVCCMMELKFKDLLLGDNRIVVSTKDHVSCQLSMFFIILSQVYITGYMCLI